MGGLFDLITESMVEKKQIDTTDGRFTAYVETLRQVQIISDLLGRIEAVSELDIQEEDTENPPSQFSEGQLAWSEGGLIEP